MGNLFLSLHVAANTLEVYNRQLATIQNNVTNQGTPGYAKQVQSLHSLPMDLDAGIPGGVGAGPLVSSRSNFAEESVRTRFAEQGLAQEKADSLSQLEPYFDVTGSAGLTADITGFFNSFSQLSLNPNDQVSRQAVLDAGDKLSASFRQTANGINLASFEVDRQMNDSVSSINRIASEIQAINVNYQKNFHAQSDPGLDAQLNAALEELSEYSGFSTSKGANGTINVFLGGEVPLVLGDTTYPISTDQSQVPVRILNVLGQEITGKITTGKLAGTVSTRNEYLPAYLDRLNTLASSLADKVNHQLALGVDAQGATGVDMFTYDSVAGAAMSMQLTSITPDQIAAANWGSAGGNDNALSLSALAKDTSLDGYTFTGFYGAIAGQVGKDISAAKSDLLTQESMLTQARSLRSEISGVSLNDEATLMMQVQKAYQATGKLINVLNDLTDTLVNLIR